MRAAQAQCLAPAVLETVRCSQTAASDAAAIAPLASQDETALPAQTKTP